MAIPATAEKQVVTKGFYTARREKYYADQRRRSTTEEIYERLCAEQTRLPAAYNEPFGKIIGKALRYVVNVIDPDVIVFGGSVSNIDPSLYRSKTELEKWIQQPTEG
jgi:predicted NBD/HSP70 family sugar kinase